jgi:hypothetical protein
MAIRKSVHDHILFFLELPAGVRLDIPVSEHNMASGISKYPQGSLHVLDS